VSERRALRLKFRKEDKTLKKGMIVVVWCGVVGFE